MGKGSEMEIHIVKWNSYCSIKNTKITFYIFDMCKRMHAWDILLLVFLMMIYMATALLIDWTKFVFRFYSKWNWNETKNKNNNSNSSSSNSCFIINNGLRQSDWVANRLCKGVLRLASLSIFISVYLIYSDFGSTISKIHHSWKTVECMHTHKQKKLLQLVSTDRNKILIGMKWKESTQCKRTNEREINEIDITQIVKKRNAHTHARAHSNTNCIQIRLHSFQFVYQ